MADEGSAADQEIGMMDFSCFLGEAYQMQLVMEWAVNHRVHPKESNACRCPFLEHGDCATTRLLMARRYTPVTADIVLQLIDEAAEVRKQEAGGDGEEGVGCVIRRTRGRQQRRVM
jgi:hypothetical protein